MQKIHFLIFLFPLFLCQGFTGLKKPDTHNRIPEKPFENSRFEIIDSVSIHYRVWNDTLRNPRGKIILIHGFCGSTFCWRYNFDALVAAHYKVVAIDLPGFGYSQRSPSLNQSQSNRARLLWGLLEKIEHVSCDTARDW